MPGQYYLLPRPKLKILRNTLKVQESSYACKNTAKHNETTSRAPLAPPPPWFPGSLRCPQTPYSLKYIYIYVYMYIYIYTAIRRALCARTGALVGQSLVAPWALVGRALGGPPGPLWAGPLWAPLGLVGPPGPCPWARPTGLVLAAPHDRTQPTGQ